MQLLAEPYGKTKGEIIKFWGLTSESMELFPWETSWLIREIGRSRPDHSLSAAILRGMNVPTPSWRSTRYSVYMRIEPADPPDRWMLEDVQLRCEMAARSMEEALETASQGTGSIPQNLQGKMNMNLAELAAFHRRALAYAYHLRETNLAFLMRKAIEQGQPVPEKLSAELMTVMKKDLSNFEEEQASLRNPATWIPPGNSSPTTPWKEMADAIALLQKRWKCLSEDIFTAG